MRNARTEAKASDKLATLARTLALLCALCAQPIMSKTSTPQWHEVLSHVLQGEVPAVGRILLYGPPDTGKTTSAQNARPGKPCYRVQCSRQQGIEDLLGGFTLCDGKTVFVPGPVPQAMADGATLLVDEFDLRNPAHDSIWHAVLDDPRLQEVRLPDGNVIRPRPGFVVIATTNASPSAFSPALQRRFELKLFCGTAHPKALDTLPPELASMVKNWQLALTPPVIKVELSVTALATFTRLSAGLYDKDTAANLLFGADGAREFISTLASNQKGK